MPLYPGEAPPAQISPIMNANYNLWQDGTTFTGIADGTWGPDGWLYNKAGAVVHDLLRSTDVPAVASNAPLSNYSLQLDVTTVDASIAAGDYCMISTRIEGYNWLPFAQRVCVLGFWVKAAKTGIHCIYAKNSGADRTYVAEYTVSAADTWEYKVVVIPASPSAGTWDYTNGRGIEISWVLAVGSTFQTTAGAWQTGNFIGTANQVNELDNTANNFRIYGAHLTVGVDVPFVPLPVTIEELRCRRYNEVMGGFSLALYGAGHCSATTTAEFSVPMVPKRATPSVANVGTLSDLKVYIAGSNVAVTALSLLSAGPTQAWVRATVASGLTAGQAVNLITFSATTTAIRFASRIP